MKMGVSVVVKAGLKELQSLLKDDDDMWIKSPEDGRDVLDEDKYLQAFPRSIHNRYNNISWTTESSRAVVSCDMNHLDLADMITDYAWDFLFPNMVATDKTLKLYSSGSEASPHMSSQLVRKQLHAASPMLATRNFTVFRTCLRIDQGTWMVAEISLDGYNNIHFCRRLPSGCLIERITEDESKVTWVEHTEVAKSVPNQTSAFAFGAERMAAWLQRYCELTSYMDATHSLQVQQIDFSFNQQKLTWMGVGEIMVRGLFQNITPIHNTGSTFFSSVTTAPDLSKVHASLYKSSFPNLVVAAAVVTFQVQHSPDFVLDTLGDGRIHHEWDVLGEYRKLCMPIRYPTGGDHRNNISASLIQGSSDKVLIKQVDVNRSGSLVLWSTVSKEYFDLVCNGAGVSEDSVLISGFFISTDGHTTATNTCGSLITLVLRRLVELEGYRSSQEKKQQAIHSITLDTNQTVERVKEALDKQRPPSPRERLTEEQGESSKKPKFL